MSDGILPSGTPPAPPAPRPDGSILVNKAPVTQSPPAAAPPQDGGTARLQGQVIAEKPPVEGQVRIRTDKGDVVIRSDRPLPPDTQVIVDLQRQKAALVATLRISQRISDAQAEIPTPAPALPATTPATAPPPPVLPGDRLIALVLTGSLTAPLTAPALPAAELQQAVRQAITSGLTEKIPLPAQLLSDFAASTDPEGFLLRLPPEQRQMLQQSAASLQMTTPTAPPADEDGLMALLRAMTTARLTQQGVQALPSQIASPAGTAPLPGMLQALLPLLQNLQQTPTPAPGQLPFQNAPAGAELRIVHVQLPGNPAPTPTPAITPPIQQGQVIGQTSSGMAVIRTPQADIVLNARVALPVGSQITFEATPLTFDALAARVAAGGSALSFDPLASRQWPALTEALQILAQHAPDAARALNNSLPAPGARMVPATLFFMAALKLGIVENWIGAQNLQVLRDHGGRNTADRLGSDFSAISRQSGETLNGDWRGFSLPMLHDAQLSQLQIFVRRQNDDKNGDGSESGQTTRFLVNLSLSRMGDMQLDGLMRQGRNAAGAATKNLDMVIRTADRLPGTLMQDLQTAYARGLGETGLTGTMQFQANKKGWIAVTPASPENTTLA